MIYYNKKPVKMILQKGDKGLSAYELYQEKGGTLSLEQWLVSLKAPIPISRKIKTSAYQEDMFMQEEDGVGHIYARFAEVRFCNLLVLGLSPIDKKTVWENVGYKNNIVNYGSSRESAPGYVASGIVTIKANYCYIKGVSLPESSDVPDSENKCTLVAYDENYSQIARFDNICETSSYESEAYKISITKLGYNYYKIEFQNASDGFTNAPKRVSVTAEGTGENFKIISDSLGNSNCIDTGLTFPPNNSGRLLNFIRDKEFIYGNTLSTTKDSITINRRVFISIYLPDLSTTNYKLKMLGYNYSDCIVRLYYSKQRYSGSVSGMIECGNYTYNYLKYNSYSELQIFNIPKKEEYSWVCVDINPNNSPAYFYNVKIKKEEYYADF